MERLARTVEQLSARVDQLAGEQGVQFKRLAQLQAELDSVKQAWRRMSGV
jgi:hypothetical protein